MNCSCQNKQSNYLKTFNRPLLLSFPLLFNAKYKLWTDIAKYCYILSLSHSLSLSVWSIKIVRQGLTDTQRLLQFYCGGSLTIQYDHCVWPAGGLCVCACVCDHGTYTLLCDELLRVSRLCQYDIDTLRHPVRFYCIQNVCVPVCERVDV